MRKSGLEGVIRQGAFQGTNLDNQMSISMNSNEEISFVTPDSNAMKSKKTNLKNNLFARKGAVPNTKLVYDDNDYKQLESPNTKNVSKEVSISSNSINLQNPAIYEAFKVNYGGDNQKENQLKIPNHLSDISGEDYK